MPSLRPCPSETLGAPPWAAQPLLPLCYVSICVLTPHFPTCHLGPSWARLALPRGACKEGEVGRGTPGALASVPWGSWQLARRRGNQQFHPRASSCLSSLAPISHHSGCSQYVCVDALHPPVWLEWGGGATMSSSSCSPSPCCPLTCLHDPHSGPCPSYPLPRPSRRHMPLNSLPLAQENISRKIYFCINVNKVSVSCVQLQPGLLRISVCSASRLQPRPQPGAGPCCLSQEMQRG